MIDDQSLTAARNLLFEKDFGVLSTLSVKLGGFPFGSTVPYCLDGDGMIVILISSIAQHTKNIQQDSRCSITVLPGGGDVQANQRICVIGHMKEIGDQEEAVKERYYRCFPDAKSYHATHDFSFYRLVPTTVRYIGGFGAIHWIEGAAFSHKNPFLGTSEERIVDHMNSDHLKDLIGYCQHYKKLPVVPGDDVRMTAIDPSGFDVYWDKQKIRFHFSQEISSMDEARQQMISLSKQLK